MNELGLDVSAVGNHEFDKGFADLTDRVIAGGTNAEWDYLGANVYDAATGEPALPEYGIYSGRRGDRRRDRRGHPGDADPGVAGRRRVADLR